MLERIIRLGQQLENELSGINIRLEAEQNYFVERAATLLDTIPNDYLALQEEILAGKLDCQPYLPNHKFADCRLTLFTSELFLIEVNVWQHQFTDIHEHQFVGAFKVIHGCAMEAEYAFEPDGTIASTHLKTGRLSLVRAQSHVVGSIQKILRSHHFIHNVIHVDNPTATLIIRSKRVAAADEPQFNYIHGLCYNPLYKTPQLHQAIGLAAISKGVSEDSYIQTCHKIAQHMFWQDYAFFLFAQLQQAPSDTVVDSLIHDASLLHGPAFTAAVITPFQRMAEVSSLVGAARQTTNNSAIRGLLNCYEIFGNVADGRTLLQHLFADIPEHRTDVEIWAVHQINAETQLFEEKDLEALPSVLTRIPHHDNILATFIKHILAQPEATT